jgi:hypothetical protein
VACGGMCCVWEVKREREKGGVEKEEGFFPTPIPEFMLHLSLFHFHTNTPPPPPFCVVCVVCGAVLCFCAGHPSFGGGVICTEIRTHPHHPPTTHNVHVYLAAMIALYLCAPHTVICIYLLVKYDSHTKARREREESCTRSVCGWWGVCQLVCVQPGGRGRGPHTQL